MNKISLLVFLQLITTFCFSQSRPIVDNEQYNSYEKKIIYDNLIMDLIPEILLEHYYNKLEDSDIKNKNQIINTSKNTRSIFVLTKLAKRGYLKVNALISKVIEEEKINIYNSKIKYVINGINVVDVKSVKMLMNLKRFKTVVIIVNTELNEIKVKIDK